MQDATIESFTAAYDEISKKNIRRFTNLFKSTNEIQEIINSQKCLLQIQNEAIFFLVPKHDIYNELFYVSINENSFNSDINAFLKAYQEERTIFTSIVGKEDFVVPIKDAFVKNNFDVLSKLLRIKITPPPQKVINGMRILAATYLKSVSFAELSDAEEIYEMIKDEFDIIGHNIPDLNEIKKNILNKNVCIIRIDGRIASMHYFVIQNGISHGYYDITRKEYRGADGLIFAINVFEHQYFLDNNIKVKRFYGWREEDKSRLIKSSKLCSSQPDGVVIYNMLHRK